MAVAIGEFVGQADAYGSGQEMRAKKLFIKHEHGAQPSRTDSIDFSPEGIAKNVACAPFRQILLASESVTADCGVRDGDLLENVVIDCDGLYDLPSGTVVQIGHALIRLTFHCEPCRKIVKFVDHSSPRRRIRKLPQ